MSAGNIKVVVRCRPLNARELARGAKSLITMDGNRTTLQPPELTSTTGRATEKKPAVFSFDKSYWSAGSRDDPNYASQHTLYDDLGVELLDHSFEGFNTCIFAYGQTGSGKSYSMMGYGPDKGIIPLTCMELFRRVEDMRKTDPSKSFQVEVSYIEIYNEKVRDLLNPKIKGNGNLKVREHPSFGPYVEGVAELAVTSYHEMMTLMDEGNKARTVASTNMNETSSRSHAVFTLILTQNFKDAVLAKEGGKKSKISLVDLAGSERQASTGATGTRLQEGANINKSLTTLGKVIAALSRAGEPPAKGKRKKEEHIPYRDSVLTWLLKESLGGNSKTAMIAAISPADYEETLSTLRYADAAKKIRTHAVINEDANAKLIRELKEELEVLRSRAAQGMGSDEATYNPNIPPEKQIVTYRTKAGEIKQVTKLELQDQLQASEKLMETLNLSWEEKMAQTQKIHVEREKALEELGITIDKNSIGVHPPQKHASLVNLNEDPLMSECLVYQLKPGKTTVGSEDSPQAQIKLSGTNISEEHCVFVNHDSEVTLECMPDARTFVNGKRVPPKSPIRLHHGFRVILGDFHVFRFNDPAGVRAHRTRMSGMWSNGGTEPGTPQRSDSPATAELMDWTAARREVANIESMGDQDLDKLFDDIVKVRTLRGRPDSRLDMAFEADSSRMFASMADDSVVDGGANPWESQNGNGHHTGHHSAASSGSRTETAGDGSESITKSTRSEAVSTNTLASDDTALEQQVMTKQLRTLAQEVKRIRSQAAVARAKGMDVPDITSWTPRQLVLARRAVDKWKMLRNFSMAEEVLKHAADVREANIIAKQMGKRMSYNFVIVDGPVACPISSLDDLGGIIEFDDVADPAALAGPRVVVKVVDHESTSVYTWNLVRFQQQLARMRQVLQVKDRPQYSVHFSVNAPFADEPTPSFSYIGGARVPLQLLAYQASYTVTVPIFCTYTMEAIGSCRVDLSCGPNRPLSGDTAVESATSGPVFRAAPFGKKLSFTITVDSVKGLTSADFAEVHAQTRLSSLVGPAISSEDTYASLPVNLDQASVAHLILRRTLSVLATPDMVTHFETGYATIEFYARVRHSYLERLERFDKLKEEVPLEASNGSSSPSNSESNGVMRIAENETTKAEHHDVLASVEIFEMGGEGEYRPSDVEDDIVQLHLGVQRQLCLTLNHASGSSFKWTKVVHASAGNVRAVTNNGEPTTVAGAEVGIQLVSHVEYFSDGTSKLIARGTWDSAAHHCIQFDRRTPGEDYLIVHLTFMVEIEGVDEPAVLGMDVQVRIIGRDARRSSIRTFWRPRPVNNVVAIFAVDLTPPLARTARDLWRLDTARKPVANERLLNGWRPRSIALVREYTRLALMRCAIADVQTTHVVINRVADLAPTKSDEAGQTALLEKCVGLWEREMETRVVFDVDRESSAEKELAERIRRLVPDLEPRLVPSVQLVPPNESIIKRGTLALLKDSRRNKWDEAQAVLRPPYLHLHPDMNKRETQIINVAHASVVASPDVEMLLGRRFAFTVFTPTNSYIIQAASQRELDDWLTVITRQRLS